MLSGDTCLLFSFLLLTLPMVDGSFTNTGTWVISCWSEVAKYLLVTYVYGRHTSMSIPIMGSAALLVEILIEVPAAESERALIATAIAVDDLEGVCSPLAGVLSGALGINASQIWS
jgi:hypothetical protein